MYGWLVTVSNNTGKETQAVPATCNFAFLMAATGRQKAEVVTALLLNIAVETIAATIHSDLVYRSLLSLSLPALLSVLLSLIYVH